MSVLVKGMEMPKNGWKHIMLTSDGKAYRFEDLTAGVTATRYEAVEVPQQWQDVFVKKTDTSGSMYDGVDMYGREWKEEDGET